MAPGSKKIISIQRIRETELKGMLTNIRGKDRGSLTRGILRERIELVKSVWSEIRGSHAELCGREDEDALRYLNDNVFARVQRLFEEILDEFVTLRDSLPEPSTSRASSSNSSLPEVGCEVSCKIAKLPKLDLPKFSGRYEDWDSFYQLFSSMVHERADLTDVVKLQYLKLSLTSIAAEYVKGVAITDTNYNSTWRALKLRFCNPRVTLRAYFSELMQLPSLKRESSEGLRVLIDRVQSIIRALSNLGLPVQHWGLWIIHVVTGLLDPESQKLLEAELSLKDQSVVARARESDQDPNILERFPTFDEFIAFLERRALSLNIIPSNSQLANQAFRPLPGRATASWQGSGIRSTRFVSTHVGQRGRVGNIRCPLCTAAHSLYQCPRFLKKSAIERRSSLRKLRLCFNCMGNHPYSSCLSSKRCAICNERHHTLLHLKESGRNKDESLPVKTAMGSADLKTDVEKPAGVLTMKVSSSREAVLLATAVVILCDPQGNKSQVRTLIDPGSEVTIVTEAVAQRLQLFHREADVPLVGIGGIHGGIAKHKVGVGLMSVHEAQLISVLDAYVLPQISTRVPSCPAKKRDIHLFAGLQLADPHFYKTDPVDLLIGADYYGDIILLGLKRFPPTQAIALPTRLGWIILGVTEESVARRAVRENFLRNSMHCVTNDTLKNSMKKFWEIEDIKAFPRVYSKEEEQCETYFQANCSRNKEGRFEVALPLKHPLPLLASESRNLAVQSLYRLHRRFDREEKLCFEYKKFMRIYIQLGHMIPVPTSEINNPAAWYLPHHAVVQASNENWKLRVVFDASRRTGGQYCLNDFLHPGPALQSELPHILLQWRQYRYAYTADIIKMFRQINVRATDQDYQRIVWSEGGTSPPRDYRLTTVTYGTSCAPYLAIRVLRQLAKEQRDRFPAGSECLEFKTYVDDVFDGAHELDHSIRRRNDLINLLKTAGIELGKWAATHSDLIPSHHLNESMTTDRTISLDETVKALGVLWVPREDFFKFRVEPISTIGPTSMRSVMSGVARLFDPLGWITPVTVVAKILLQDLWILKCNIDDRLPCEIEERWVNYCNSLKDISEIRIDRWFGTGAAASNELHGFSDASKRAYGAVIYIRVTNEKGQGKVSLLTSKTKVSPIKTVSVPNLELSGAALLVRLFSNIRKLEFFRNAPITSWTDSQVVLAWLRKHPCHWRTYVANRVSFIQTELPSAEWRHVKSSDNPADLCSRGLGPTDLRNAKIWWHGPPWLSSARESWPDKPAFAGIVRVPSDREEREPKFFRRFSSLNTMIRAVARCARLFRNFRARKNSLPVDRSYLSFEELKQARLAIIRMSQAVFFKEELRILSDNNRTFGLASNHFLTKLNPFVCPKDKILRVGGRLSHSQLVRDAMHPPILARQSELSKLFVRCAHLQALHGGVTLTQSRLLQHVWVIGGKTLVKREIRFCVTCQKAKPKLAHQLMGDLPADRITPTSRPFEICGLDYAGPIMLRTSKERRFKRYKGYIALFICFTTKAVHLEVVEDQTTEEFLMAFRRFSGRRGLCRKLYSDNGTTFIGAARELRTMFDRASQFYADIAGVLANGGTDWSFIPPHTPHCGGLWEAGIKSTKTHLKKIIGDRLLTFAELSTVLIEIEACLNSRPLCALTDSVDDLTALSPAHFWNCGALTILPDGEIGNIPDNRLNRYQRLQCLREHFWRRWSGEYLHTLQGRSKWKRPSENLNLGQLVLLKDDRFPAGRWPLGRITELHPGADGLVRVVTVKTATSTFRRHIAKLYPLKLPTQEKPFDASDLPPPHLQ